MKYILDNCIFSNNNTLLLLPKNIGIEKRYFIILKTEIELLGGQWLGADTFGFNINNATEVANSLKIKFHDC